MMGEALADRPSLLDDPAIRTIISGMISSHVDVINPVFDADRRPRYVMVENLLGDDYVTIKHVLNEMSSANLLIRELYERLVCCPQCGSPSMVFLRLTCPRCGSLNIFSEKLMEHIKCGVIGKRSLFEKDGVLKCPKCGVPVTLGSDLRVIGALYECLDCKSNFDSPREFFYCRDCELSFTITDAKFEEVYSFRINREVMDKVREIFTEPFIKQALEEAGFEVEAPGYIIGASGLTLSFNLVARRNGELVVLDLLRSQPAVDVESVIFSYGKIIDARPSKAVMIAVPRFTDRARSFVETHSIIGLEGEGPAEIIDRLRKIMV